MFLHSSTVFSAGGVIQQMNLPIFSGSITGPIVTYASVGEQVFHVWQCESDLFSVSKMEFIFAKNIHSDACPQLFR
jgi:hypothetical protein